MENKYSKFSNHIYKYKSLGEHLKLNFVPMIFEGKKLIFMKMGKSAGSAIWGHTLKPYVNRVNGWTAGQGGSAEWLKGVTNKEIDKEYLVFIFVRNPFGRVVSWFHSSRHGDSKENFNKYVREEFLNSNGVVREIPDNGHLWPASTHCEYEDGQLFVDFIGKVENLDKDWLKFCKEVEIPYTKIPKVNVRANIGQHYSHYYTDESIDIVSKFYKRDLELFNYDF